MWPILLPYDLAGIATLMATTVHRAVSEHADPNAINLMVFGRSQIILVVFGVALVGITIVVSA